MPSSKCNANPNPEDFEYGSSADVSGAKVVDAYMEQLEDLNPASNHNLDPHPSLTKRNLETF